jgi:hypothetical protein
MISRIWHGYTTFEKAVVPQKARKILGRFDRKSQHYEVKIDNKI